jgi:hypothetical protein
VQDAGSITEIFDAVSYDKGASVIRCRLYPANTQGLISDTRTQACVTCVSKETVRMGGANRAGW